MENKEYAKTNQEFDKKEYKNYTLFEKIVLWAVRIGTNIIAIVVTLLLFVFKKPCDIDNQYAWCRVHPTSFFDVLGVFLFYVGCFWIGGLGPWIVITKLGADDDEDTQKKFSVLSFIAALIGFLLIWFA